MLGLDVTAAGVRLVELRQGHAGPPRLESCGQERFQRDWVRDGHFDKFDQVVDATRRLMRRAKTTARHAAMALPSSEVISKRVILPAGLSEREMEFQVESEARQYLSFPVEQVSLDFCVLGPSPASPVDMEVLIAAARKEKVEDRQALAEAAGLTLTVLDVDSHAASLVVKRLMAESPGAAEAMVALIELDAGSMNLQVLRNEQLLYERDGAFGSAEPTRTLMQHDGYGFDQAQPRQVSAPLPDDHVETVLLPYLARLASEVEHALRLFFTSTPHHRVDQIMLAGDMAGLDGLAETVADLTATPCAIANPFHGMQLGRQLRSQQLARDAPAYLTACGLALRGFLQ